MIDHDKLRALVDFARAELEDPPAIPELAEAHLTRRVWQTRNAANVSALCFASLALAELGDPLAADAVLALEGHARELDGHALTPRALAQSLAELMLLGGADAVPTAAKLATSSSTCVRLAVAQGLQRMRSDEDAKHTLFRLAGDAQPLVRDAAKRSLGGEGPPPWFGIFPRDPLASRNAKEAAELGPPLRRALELEAQGYPSDEERDELGRVLDSLPDDLALPIVRRSFGRMMLSHVVTLRRFLKAPDTHAEALELLHQRLLAGDVMFADGLQVIASELPVPQRASLARCAITKLRESDFSTHFFVEKILVAAAPGAIDLDEVIGAALETNHLLLTRAACTLLRDPQCELGDAPKRLFPMMEASDQGPITVAARERFMTHPTAGAAALARRWLRSRVVEQQAFALRVLTAEGDAATMIDEAFASPRLRGAVFSDDRLLTSILSRSREILVSAELTAAELVCVLRVLGRAPMSEEEAAAIRARMALATPKERAEMVMELPAEQFAAECVRTLEHVTQAWCETPNDHDATELLMKVLFRLPAENALRRLREIVAATDHPDILRHGLAMIRFLARNESTEEG